MTARVAVPSRGRLREGAIDLLRRAGYPVGGLDGSNASVVIDDLELIEMRPTDAAAWLAAGHLDAGFVSTDTALEHRVDDWPTVELGYARSDLVLACRQDAPFRSVADLDGCAIATHLPGWTERWLASKSVDAEVVAMGGSLEGVCARGLADAIVDLRATGASLARNALHAIEVAEQCEAVFTMAPSAGPAVDGLLLRIEAARSAARTQYLMLHIDPRRVDALGEVFPGLAAPTLLPLSGRDDLVAVHMVVDRAALWNRLGDLRALGATGIVALPADAIVE